MLLHFTSLPGPYGAGDLGPEAYNFLDWLAAAGQRCWQFLPLNPPGPGDSPYAARSSFAGNPMLISLDLLVRDGLLDEADLEDARYDESSRIDFGWLTESRERLLRLAHDRFVAAGRLPEMESFAAEHAAWLPDFALFVALRSNCEGSWCDWDEGLRTRQPSAIAQARQRFAAEISHQCFLQWLFFSQWTNLHAAARARGISLIGDIPIFVDYDSADVWSQPGLFKLGQDGRPTVVAGVPPDAFSERGQRWGNPLYDWSAHERQGFEWWVRRLHHTLTMVDEVRIDHFRGFEASWEIPVESPTAEQGTWGTGPRAALFEAAAASIGRTDIVVEDLGMITPEVRSLRDGLGFPGMTVLQFAFGDDAANLYLPHNHAANTVVYTGTHDNDTTAGWWERLPEWHRARVRDYLARDGSNIVDDLIRTAYSSVGHTAIVPMQDIARLGSEARMNIPGEESGHWGWRFGWDKLAPERTEWLRSLAQIYGRLPTSP